MMFVEALQKKMVLKRACSAAQNKFGAIFWHKYVTYLEPIYVTVPICTVAHCKKFVKTHALSLWPASKAGVI